jgi:hypothetical protein
MTQFPDVIDKPLAWTAGVFGNGTSVAHSIFVAMAVIALAVRIDDEEGPRRVSTAVGIGYLTHLAGDAAYPLLVGDGNVALSVMLWPVVPGPDRAPAGFVTRFGELFAKFVEFLGTPLGRLYLLGELVLIGGAVALWLYDGRPGLGLVVRPLRERLPTD